MSSTGHHRQSIGNRKVRLWPSNYKKERVDGPYRKVRKKKPWATD